MGTSFKRGTLYSHFASSTARTHSSIADDLNTRGTVLAHFGSTISFFTGVAEVAMKSLRSYEETTNEAMCVKLILYYRLECFVNNFSRILNFCCEACY